MLKILVLTLMLQVAKGFDDAPRFFTNGHGGYQFFHADEQNVVADRRIDSDASFSNAVQYVVKAEAKPEPEIITEGQEKATSAAPPVKVTTTSHNFLSKLKLSNKLQSASKSENRNEDSSDASSENRILKDVTSSKPRARYTTPRNSAFNSSKVTRKRIIVRKFKPRPKTQLKTPAEKNKKREISASAGNDLLAAQHSKIPHKYKFTNRNFKPRQVEKPKNNAQSKLLSRGALFTRKPSDKFMQLHFRKLDVTTSTTTASTMQQGLKEKRHLANIRFFNRRKLRS